MIENGLYKLMSTAEGDGDQLDFVLNLEVLNKCKHSCLGCYVNRRNSVDDVNLQTALEIAQDLSAKGYRFREVILSPTDIFSCDNALEILKDPAFQALMRIHPKTRITTTAMFENMDTARFLEIFDVLDNPEFFAREMILEFLVPMNVQKMLANDLQYLEDHHRALNFLKNHTPKLVDWSFVVNVHHDQDFISNFDELTVIAREKFDTIIEFLPSFFRTGKDHLIASHLQTWKEFLQEAVTDDNYRNVMLTIADKNHNAQNTLVLNYRKNNLYISPFIYEQIVHQHTHLQVEPLTADAAIQRFDDSQIEQYQYAAEKTKECGSCHYLNTCVGRNVISFMEMNNLSNCIYPKEVLDRYDDTASLSNRVARCS
ncbi:hypothetical protein D3C75_739450 [compost metagenome]